jgi:hypothetical protein
VIGFPIVPLVLEGVRYAFRAVTSLAPNNPEEERRHPVLTGGDFEHEAEHVHEHEEQSISQQPLAGAQRAPCPLDGRS